MSPEMISTRRSLLKAGALLAAPVAVPAAAAAVANRPAHYEDEAAIRQLHYDWLRRINAGDAPLPDAEAIYSIAPDHHAAPDKIDMAEDGRTAIGRYHCAVERRSELPRDCTLGQMAHAQGTGYVHRTEPRVVEIAYVKANRGWTIARVEFMAGAS